MGVARPSIWPRETGKFLARALASCVFEGSIPWILEKPKFLNISK